MHELVMDQYLKLCIMMACAVVLVGFSACQEQAESTDQSAQQELGGTVKMEREIRQIRRNVNLDKNPYLSRARSEIMLQKSQSQEADVMVVIGACRELIHAGKNEMAIVQLESMTQFVESQPPSAQVLEAKNIIYPLLALAYWRLAEEVNCLGSKTSATCTLPFESENLYRNKTAALKAIQIIEKILALNPNDWNHIWMLNVAHMALGSYPEKVPQKYLIPPDKFQNDTDFPRFEDVANDINIAVKGTAGASIVDDFNGDYLLDVFVTSWGINGKCHLFIQSEDGKFVDATNTWDLGGTAGGLHAIQADYDNDGYLDIFLMRGAWITEDVFPNSLLRNVEGKYFQDVTHDAGIYSKRPGQTAVWMDFNLDGNLDLYVGNESKNIKSGDMRDQNADHLFLNLGNGKFSDIIKTSGLDLFSYTKGASSADINGDGLSDLYVSNLGEKNSLYLNISTQDKIQFKKTDGCEGPISSFPCWFFDFDQDGDEDLFVASFYTNETSNNFSGFMAKEYMQNQVDQELSALYINDGMGGFSDMASEMGLRTNMFAMGSNFGDLNGDGYPDFLIGTGEPYLGSIIPNRMFLNQDGRRFVDISYSGGFAHLQKGHAVSFADIDNDGDQDVHATMGGAFEGDVYFNALYKNPGFKNDFIKLHLVGKECNRSAIGAKITVYTEGRNNTSKKIHHRVTSGGSFGANPLIQTIGLGKLSEEKVAVDINWPGQKDPQGIELQRNSLYQIIQNESAKLIPEAAYSIVQGSN